ncbi:hypothetical protein PMAYCL1PPCAC_16610, partial [Pristionchus mayeri]
ECSSTSAASMSAMSFHFGAEETVLFDFWKFNSTWGLILTCVILVALSVMKELAKTLRSRNAKVMKTKFVRNLYTRGIDLLLHFIIMTISYFLMVIFMNLNVWMSITIVVAEVLVQAISAYCTGNCDEK